MTQGKYDSVHRLPPPHRSQSWQTLPLPPPCRNRRPPSRLPLSPPETTTHHYAAQKTDSSPAISVWNNVAIAHAKERYGYQPETVQDVDVLVVVVPELCNRSLTTWIGEGDSSEAREWLHSIRHGDYLLFTWWHPWLLWYGMLRDYVQRAESW